MRLGEGEIAVQSNAIPRSGKGRGVWSMGHGARCEVLGDEETKRRRDKLISLITIAFDNNMFWPANGIINKSKNSSS